jgi:ATP-dependent DNA helicase DinG
LAVSTVNPRTLLVNRDLNPLLQTLPPQFESFRPGQIEAVDQITRAFKRGVKVVVLAAPTGTGKTLIGETVRRMLGGKSAVYVCSDRGLQHQFHGDFPYSRVLMGRSNYPTVHFADQYAPGEAWSVSAEDCTKTEVRDCMLCPSKRDCPYEIAKHDALSSFLPVLNTSYFLHEANGPGRFKGRPLAIIDEADLLESALMGYVSVDVGSRKMVKYGWEHPKLTVASDWRRWAIEHAAKAMEIEAEGKEATYLSALIVNLSRIAGDIGAGEHSWVYDGDRSRVSFKPSRVMSYGEGMLWDKASQWLLMSASIISAGETLWSLGYKGDYEVVELGSPFDIRNRLIHVRPVGDMTKKAAGKDDEVMVDSIRGILDRHGNDRVIIHTVSYDRTNQIATELRRLLPSRRIIAYTTANSRGAALSKYKATKASVLVGPSLDRGVDLPGDLCRVQVIAKVPFPNLGDKVVNARYHSGREGKVWYTMQTVRTIVQMTGRAVRNKDDWATTYILDKAFGDRLWSKGGREMFPPWWKEAIVWERP